MQCERCGIRFIYDMDDHTCDSEGHTMKTQTLIANLCAEFTQDVREFHTKPHLLDSLKSHVREHTNGVCRDTIERGVNDWFSTLLAEA